MLRRMRAAGSSLHRLRSMRPRCPRHLSAPCYRSCCCVPSRFYGSCRRRFRKASRCRDAAPSFKRDTLTIAMELSGCGTALVTPFRADGALDETALVRLVNWQIESGIKFLIPCGTTGEASTLTESEWLRVIEMTVETAA